MKEEIEKSLPQILDILQEINQWDVQICSWQLKRQSELWKVIDALVSQIGFFSSVCMMLLSNNFS